MNYRMFDFTVFTSGCSVSDETLAEGVSVSGPYEYHTGADLCAMRTADGKLYISSGLLSLMIGRSLDGFAPRYRVGRQRFFDVSDPDMAEDVIDHANYPARSARERGSPDGLQAPHSTLNG